MMIQELKNLDQSGENNSTSCCTPALTAPVIGTKEARQIADLFAALADPTRLTILSLLAKSEQKEVCVCDITAYFKVGQPTISHHLKILKDAELIQGDKRGKWVYYSLVANRANEVKEMLDKVLSLSALT